MATFASLITSGPPIPGVEMSSEGLLLPLEGNNIQSERFRDQIEASLPLKKQLWQQTVESKIRNQAAVLKYVTGYDARNMAKSE